MADFERQTGALAQQVQELAVDPVDTLAQGGQPIAGRRFI
jgi:hypothetical protein